MSVPTLIRRELKNARLRFIPVGETVDTVTVSKTTWPDGAPTTNWTAYDFPDVEKVGVSYETIKEDFLVPADGGDYENNPEEWVRTITYTFDTAKTNSYLKRLEHATSADLVTTVAQRPAAPGVQNYIEGVALIEIQGKTGAILERIQFWGRLRLVTPGDKAAPTTSKLQYSIEMRQAGNNTVVVI